MQADPAQAIEALTRSFRELSQIIARPDWITRCLTGILAACNLVLAVAAMLSAKRARQAAEASRDMVAIERERQREADRPELEMRVSSQGASSGMTIVQVRNIGPGVAGGKDWSIEYTYAYALDDGQLRRCSPHQETPPEARILEGKKPDRKDEWKAKVTFLAPQDRRKREVAICHYTDIFHSEKDPRVYHTVRDSEPVQMESYYPWNQGIPAEYKHICMVCNP